MNGRIRRGIGRTRGRERSESDDIPKLRRIPRRRCAICEISRRLVRRVRLCMRSRRSFTCYVSLPPLLSSLVPSCSFARPFARSLSLPAFLPHSSTWFYHAITCTIDHARRSARSRKRETEMNGGRGKRSCELAAKLTFYLFYIDRVIIFANIVQIVFDALRFSLIILENLRTIILIFIYSDLYLI